MRSNFGFIITFVLLSCFYTNCSVMTAASDGSSLASRESVNCDADLLNTYKDVVYPFFKSTSTCIGCHVEGGPGIGVFSSSSVESSFASFEGAGFSKVQYMATNPQHKPPYTGIQNQPAMDAISPVWTAAESQHLTCVSKLQNGGVDASLLTSPKAAPSIYAANNGTQTLTWDLDLGSDLDSKMTRSIPARATIDVKVLYQMVAGVKTATGYTFSNPTLLVKAQGSQVVVEGLFFQINGRPISSQTTFTSVSRVVAGNQAIPLMVANANTLIQPVGSSDTFQLYFRRLVTADGAGDASPPLTPILSLQDSTTGASDFARQATVNTFILRDSGILRWCLSESPTRPQSTQDPCQNTTPGTVNGWYTQRPTQFNLSAGDGTKTVYLWVANDSLLINLSPAQFTISLDTVAPAAATIGGITMGQTQVAAMSVTHTNESDVTGWCVAEQSAVMGPPGVPKLDDPCWRWTDLNAKPSTVGFKGSGPRLVRVYVRDQAGNISPPSNTASASNALGAITFAQLTEATSTPRSIFTNRCLTCHGNVNNPGFSKLQLFDYNGAFAVVMNGQLVSRINNVLSPMPNVAGGLMPQAERDLVRLWTMPEDPKANPL
jgi:mono/diheme cytochrome c family protein